MPHPVTSLRLDPTIRTRLEKYATRTNRGISAAVEYLLTNALDDEDRLHERWADDDDE